MQDPLPVWVAVGGTPESAVRAGMLVLPMALGIIGGMPERFAPFVEVHRRAAGQAGHGRLPVSVNSHGYIAETREQAADDAYPPYALMMNRIGQGRGWRPMQRQDFDAAMTLRGANFVGSPQDVIDKILFQHEIVRHDRFLLQITVGAIPHDKVMRSIELFATEVVPAAARRSRVAPRYPPRRRSRCRQDGVSRGG